MPTGALLLALGAAVVHATWNLLLAGSRDPRVGGAVQAVVSVVFWAPLALAVWRFEAEALPYWAISSLLELAYFVMLATSYGEGDLSLVYPLARGGAPLLVGLAAAAGLGGSVGGVQVLGIVAIGLGVIAVRGVRGPWRGRETAMALATAACIAGYTVADHYGVRHADPLTYLWLVLTPVAIAYSAIVLRSDGAGALRAAVSVRTVLAGVGAYGSYVMALAALRLTSAAPVAAVRETSIVVAVGLAGAVLGEQVGRARMLGAVAVTAGTVLVAVG